MEKDPKEHQEPEEGADSVVRDDQDASEQPEKDGSVGPEPQPPAN
jgi:hypothetical protein